MALGRLWQKARTNRLLSIGLSLAIHGAILLGFIAVRTDVVPPERSTPVMVVLVDVPRLAPPTSRPVAQAAAPPPDLPLPKVDIAPPVPRAPRQRTDKSVQMAAATAGTGVSLGEADLAGAMSADAGAPGGACDMPRRVQSALRNDHIVLAATSNFAGQTLLVWNGDWVQGPGEEGKGMAAVREAIMWEVAFAPPECRTQAAHGLILLSLSSTAGTLRLALGSGNWRWSDLLR